MKKIMKVITKFLFVVCCVFFIGILSYTAVNAEEETEIIEDNEIQDIVENAVVSALSHLMTSTLVLSRIFFHRILL